jgi:hypothetical protein
MVITLTRAYSICMQEIDGEEELGKRLFFLDSAATEEKE